MIDDSGFDIQDLKRRAEAVREFVHKIPDAGVAFTVRFPSRFERMAIDYRHEKDVAGLVREVVRVSIQGWQGVRVSHALPEWKQDDTELPFGPDTLELLLDQQTDWLLAVWKDIDTRTKERNARIEAALKNFASGSGTNVAAPASPVH